MQQPRSRLVSALSFGRCKPKGQGDRSPAAPSAAVFAWVAQAHLPFSLGRLPRASTGLQDRCSHGAGSDSCRTCKEEKDNMKPLQRECKVSLLKTSDVLHAWRVYLRRRMQKLSQAAPSRLRLFVWLLRPAAQPQESMPSLSSLGSVRALLACLCRHAVLSRLLHRTAREERVTHVTCSRHK